MGYEEEKLAEGVKTCLESQGCYQYRGACGLSSGKKEHYCRYLDQEVVLKMGFYSSPQGNISEECFRCGYEKRVK